MNYERLLDLPTDELVRFLTGMPTRLYDTDKLDFDLLRNSFTRNFPVLADATEEFVKFIKAHSSVLNAGEYSDLKTWIVY